MNNFFVSDKPDYTNTCIPKCEPLFFTLKSDESQ